jgi:hypothetical protein
MSISVSAATHRRIAPPPAEVDTVRTPTSAPPSSTSSLTHARQVRSFTAPSPPSFRRLALCRRRLCSSSFVLAWPRGRQPPSLPPPTMISPPPLPCGLGAGNLRQYRCRPCSSSSSLPTPSPLPPHLLHLLILGVGAGPATFPAAATAHDLSSSSPVQARGRQPSPLPPPTMLSPPPLLCGLGPATFANAAAAHAPPPSSFQRPAFCRRL